MAAVIFLASLAALLQLFISYCRSLIAPSIRQPLSAEVRDVTGIEKAASGVCVREKEFVELSVGSNRPRAASICVLMIDES